MHTPNASYGCDEHGLVCGYLFEPGQPGRPIGSAEAPPWLEREAPAGMPPGHFVWLHVNLAHAGALAWLRSQAGLQDGFFEAVQAGSRSTRIERDGAQLFAVLNDVTFDFSFEASDVATLWMSLGGHFVVTARLHPLRAVDRLRAAVKRGEPLASPVALLDHLLRDQADELQRIGRSATERVDDIEDALLAGHAGRHGGELSRLRRLMVRLQRLLAPEPGALLRLLGNPPAWVSAEDVQQLRHASEEFAVVLRDIGALQERVKLLQEESAARVADENNRSLFMLTMVTVLALPINLIAGLLGMNVGGVPLASHPHGFWWVLGLVAVFTGVVAWFAFGRLPPRR
ncbi:transporter [Eleftheria terrae]|uniref:transporter n=1 Tax=Eleftheria terrae TaxID=1597781 RepID=UPI00263BD239|nr:transporter [Eleftheria terrae]WKB51821.1 transporter [Eleftheria terrae]